MIFVDASRYNNTAQGTGVENYSVNLINVLAQLRLNQITLISPRKIPLNVPQLIIPLPRLWTQLRLSLEVWKNAKLRASTLFIPSHQMPIIHPARTVITVHDVAFKRFPECYGWASRTYLDWGARFAVKHAKTIIVPSQVTKNDLIEFYKADPQKIVVIPHGYTPLCRSERASAREEPPYNLKPQHYFLFIGRIERKKNLMTLITAFNEFAKNHPDFKLVLAGKPGVGGNEIMKAAKENPNIVLMGYVDEPTKIALLKNAFAFVLPSFYEGFGFPILEAMQFDLPLILSDIPASREVAGEAALFFKPSEANELTDLMKTLVKEDQRARLIKNYPSLLAHYSWERCAEQTWRVLA